jgi:hypothetical protein
LLVACCLSPACAFGPGGPFATVEARLSAQLRAPEDRALAGGWQRLNTSYQALIESATLTVTSLELRQLSGGAAFDPANPPPGFSLCHGGHCHADSGALVPYAEVGASLGGSVQTVLALAGPGPLLLLEAPTRDLACLGSCELPRADISQVRSPNASLVLAGKVRDGLGSPRISGEQPFAATIALEGAAALTGELSLPADRAHGPKVELTLRFAPSAAILDDLDWAQMPTPAGVLSPMEVAEGAEVLRDNLTRTPLEASVAR